MQWPGLAVGPFVPLKQLLPIFEEPDQKLLISASYHSQGIRNACFVRLQSGIVYEVFGRFGFQHTEMDMHKCKEQMFETKEYQSQKSNLVSELSHTSAPSRRASICMKYLRLHPQASLATYYNTPVKQITKSRPLMCDWCLSESVHQQCCICRAAFYCGAECQQNDFFIHRLYCKLFSSLLV